MYDETCQLNKYLVFEIIHQEQLCLQREVNGNQ